VDGGGCRGSSVVWGEGGNPELRFARVVTEERDEAGVWDTCWSEEEGVVLYMAFKLSARVNDTYIHFGSHFVLHVQGGSQ